MLGKVCRMVLDILWQDKENHSLRELNQIMHASQLIFIFKDESLPNKGGGIRNIKVYLSSYIDDHTIWQDVKVWKLCLQRLINFKFLEAVKSQERSKEDQKRLE